MTKDKTHWDESKTPSENAAEVLPELAARYFEAGAQVVKPEATAEELHRLRLATKHFRYTLEGFRPVYGPALEERLARLRAVQQFLGDINDCRVTRLRFQEDLGAAALLEFLDSRLARKRREFVTFWRRNFTTKTRLKEWAGFLSKPPSGKTPHTL